MRVDDPPTAPTATQAEIVEQDTLVSTLLELPESGLGVIDQAEPFHASTRA
jgi:hypothetical protein